MKNGLTTLIAIAALYVVNLSKDHVVSFWEIAYGREIERRGNSLTDAGIGVHLIEPSTSPGVFGFFEDAPESFSVRKRSSSSFKERTYYQLRARLH